LRSEQAKFSFVQVMAAEAASMVSTADRFKVDCLLAGAVASSDVVPPSIFESVG
jgi:hypothetical protein